MTEGGAPYMHLTGNYNGSVLAYPGTPKLRVQFEHHSNLYVIKTNVII